MNFDKIYALGLRHLYLITNSFPRLLDLIYWPTVQIFLWGFISKFLTLNSEYYNNTVGVILTAAIWDAPVKTNMDIHWVWRVVNPVFTDKTPKAIPKMPIALPNISAVMIISSRTQRLTKANIVKNFLISPNIKLWK